MSNAAIGRLEIFGSSLHFNGHTPDGEVLSFHGTFSPAVPHQIAAHGSRFTYNNRTNIPGPHTINGHVGQGDVDLTLSNGCGISTSVSIATRTNIRGNGTAAVVRR